MKKLFVIIGIIIIIAISMFLGYKSYNIINKSKQFDNTRTDRFVKPDIIGEIESISESNILLKVINLSINNEVNRAKEDFKIEYTGKTKNIIISSDIKIFKNAISDKKMQQQELRSSDLKVGDILSITYKEDKTTIDKIVLNEINNSKIN
jgi:hypothetical protein